MDGNSKMSMSAAAFLFGSVMACASLLVSGCARQVGGVTEWAPEPAVRQGDLISTPAFTRRSEGPVGLVQVSEPDPIRSELISLVVNGTLRDLITILSQRGIVVVIPEESQDINVAGRFVDRPIDDVLAFMAGNLGPSAEVRQRTGYVYVGPPTDADRGVSVYFAPGGDTAAWLTAYQLAASSSGQVTAVGDLFVVRDTTDGLASVAAFHELARLPRRQYLAEVAYVEMSDEEARRIGVSIALDGALVLESVLLPSYSLAEFLTATLNGALAGDASSTLSREVQTARLHLVEGDEALIEVADVVNVRRRNISDAGTVTDVGFDQITAGTTLTLQCFSAGDVVRLELEPEVSVVTEFIDGLPSVATRRARSSVLIGDGGVAVIGGLDRFSSIDGRNRDPVFGVPTLMDRRESDRRMFIVASIRELGWHVESARTVAQDGEPDDSRSAQAPPSMDGSISGEPARSGGAGE